MTPRLRRTAHCAEHFVRTYIPLSPALLANNAYPSKASCVCNCNCFSLASADPHVCAGLRAVLNISLGPPAVVLANTLVVALVSMLPLAPATSAESGPAPGPKLLLSARCRALLPRAPAVVPAPAASLYGEVLLPVQK